MEEQLNRASTKGLIQEPSQPIMFLHARYTELESLADGHQALLKGVASGNTHAYTLLKKGSNARGVKACVICSCVALVKMEELLNEMRQDINKLPAQLANQTPVTQKLQLTDNEVLTRLAACVPSVQSGKQIPPANQNPPIIQTRPSGSYTQVQMLASDWSVLYPQLISLSL